MVAAFASSKGRLRSVTDVKRMRWPDEVEPTRSNEATVQVAKVLAPEASALSQGRPPMVRHRRQFILEFKLHVIREVEVGKSLAHASREYELHPNLIRKWQVQYASHAYTRLLADRGNPSTTPSRRKTSSIEPPSLPLVLRAADLVRKRSASRMFVITILAY